MEARARRALREIRRCFSSGRYLVLKHFSLRMDRRGLFWPDIQAVVDEPAEVRDGGLDEHARPKWILRGEATDGSDIEIVCALDQDDRGNMVVLITAYWDED